MKRSPVILPLVFAVSLAACDGGQTTATPDGSAAVDAAPDAGPPDAGTVDTGNVDTDTGALPDHAVYEDTPYAQKYHRNYTAEKDGLLSNDVRAFAVGRDGIVWAGTAGGMMYYDNGEWKDGGLAEPIVGAAAAPYSIFIWAATPNSIYKQYNGGAWEKVADVQGITAISSYSDNEVWVGSQEGFGFISNNTYELKAPVPARINDIVGYEPGTWIATDDGIFVLDDMFSVKYHFTTADGLPSNDVRTLSAYCTGDMIPMCTILAGTSGGLAYADPDSVPSLVFTVETGLPYDDITKIYSYTTCCYLLSSQLVATKIGAIAWTGSDGSFNGGYFHSRYWLPDDDVRDVAFWEAGVFFATAGGIGHVWSEEKTLADKAAHYDEINHTRHVRMGYTTGIYLPNAGDTSTWIQGDDDNDGQWTGMYLGAQAFRYAATKDPVALDYARTAMEAMLKLEEVTAIPGFFARSIVPGADCPAKQTSGGEWHPTADGTLCWKGNTSTDEFVGHMFGLTLYHDLVADEAEKARIAATVSRILTRIIDFGYVIADVDGLATQDGHMDPDFMERVGIFGDAGLNSAMILGGLRVGYHMTGDQKFMDAFKELIQKHKYHEYIRKALEISQTVQINHDSHEMMALAFFTLVRLETEERYRAWWIEGLEQFWQSQRPERNPEFNMIYAALTGSDGDLEQSADTLRRIPWELVVWGCNSSHRKDIVIDKDPDRFGRKQSTEVLPYDERYVMKWNENPFNLDMEATGNSEESATFWLLPYWMGRFHGFISGPE